MLQRRLFGARAISHSRRLFSVTVQDFKKVGVVGLGLMGHGVAQIAATAGYEVLAIESNEEALKVGMKRVDDSLGKIIAKDVKKGNLTEAEGKAKYEQIMGKFTTSTSINDAKDCDLVIEAIAENMDLKLSFYKNLGTIVKPTAVLASNTSSLAITEMGKVTGNPANFLGIHFFNPVQIMKLVEVVKTDDTSPEVFNAVTDFVKSIKKVPVSCVDTPGFIVNRLLVPYLAQAMAMLDRGEATIRDIDVSMQLGAGHPMGPLQLADYVGLDTALSILKGWRESYPDEPAFIVPKCLETMVQEGKLGRKTGQGFYEWDGDKIKA